MRGAYAASAHDGVSSCLAGQTHLGSRAVINGGFGASDEPAQQLELSHLHFDGEDQREVWQDPQSGERRAIVQHL